jgi:type VI secretion system protein ImpK
VLAADLLSNLGQGQSEALWHYSSGGASSREEGGEEFGQQVNPLVAAASQVLNVVSKLRGTTQVVDLTELSRTLAAEVRAFESRALALGVSREVVVGARYCLCTFVDEAAALTPWGSQGNWSRYGLLVQFHNETWGGEKFYQLLARLAKDVKQHRNLVELLYFCTSLGFEGQFRVIENGQSQLEDLRRRVASLLNSVGGERDKRLSLRWRGASLTEDTWRWLPPWVVAAVCGFIALIVFVYLNFSLAGRSDETFAYLGGLSLPALVQAAPPVVRATGTDSLRRFLEPEIKEGLLQVHEMGGSSVITLLGDGLFESASVDVRARYVVVLERVARALNELNGPVLIKGYTDNVPIRSVRFPSNWHLSQARADVVSGMVSQHLILPGRVRAIGRADAEPVASNDSVEGRAKNRRVDIVLGLSGDEIHRQMNTASSKREVLE